jgi:hypothetical protein
MALFRPAKNQKPMLLSIIFLSLHLQKHLILYLTILENIVLGKLHLTVRRLLPGVCLPTRRPVLCQAGYQTANVCFT